jgi:hypothetical protein
MSLVELIEGEFQAASEAAGIDVTMANLLAKVKTPNQPTPAKTGTNRRKGELILAALCEYHGYDGTQIKTDEPIAVRALEARMTKGSRGTAGRTTISRWFREKFPHGHTGYEISCRRKTLLRDLKSMRGDFSPRFLADVDMAEAPEEDPDG